MWVLCESRHNKKCLQLVDGDKTTSEPRKGVLFSSWRLNCNSKTTKRKVGLPQDCSVGKSVT